MARTLVGLDIGSSGLRAAEFAVGRRRPALRKFASLPLPPGVVRAGMVADPDALVDALKELWSTGKFGTRQVALGVANTGVLVRQMDLDWMAPKDFGQALRYQVEGALPMPVDDANLDYHLLEELDVEQDGQTRRVARVLVVAAAREMVDGFVGAVDRAGLRATSVDIVPFALIRTSLALPDAHEDRSDEAVGAEFEAIVDIGSDTVTVVVHEAGQPRYVRVIPGLGGDVVTRAVQQRYDWTWEDADRTKCAVGLPGHSTFEPEAPRADGLQHPAQQVVAEEVEALVREIATTLDYARESGDEPTLRRVLLTGAASRLGGLAELMSERLGTVVEPLAVADRIRAPRRWRGDSGLDTQLAIPAGLCLGVGA